MHAQDEEEKKKKKSRCRSVFYSYSRGQSENREEETVSERRVGVKTTTREPRVRQRAHYRTTRASSSLSRASSSSSGGYDTTTATSHPTTHPHTYPRARVTRTGDEQERNTTTPTSHTPTKPDIPMADRGRKALPVGNRLCHARDQLRSQRLHREKAREVGEREGGEGKEGEACSFTFPMHSLDTRAMISPYAQFQMVVVRR